ncbi:MULTISPECIES: DUF421 domain-containing protein [Legionella]|uniref:DUF421 domain-containing protein n=1 Tax=Legionella resiliens TaxID=2905958 RepID=A0ABS8XAX6_9GAMM|nr:MULTISPECIES: YetF domain-containing protein [unclassified Legionella]MCE0724881.1 DUF421 domain-containing protein [Legionella sp. 9fVS26]MCE3534035.1 DUF421 domain-containing protein [Legionella sp. 8cVS16]QLZ70269.1 hypothetical protein FOLKNPGA_03074 [Legionella sp. PC1000]
MLSYIYLINEDQNLVYVFIRAVLLLVIGTLLIRFGNRRFRLNNSFDLLIIVISGGLISRGINGPATLISTIIGLIALVATHKILAICTRKSLTFERIFKGKRYLLVKNGILQKKVLQSLNITQKDIEEQMRQQIHTSSLDKVLFAYLERTGHISFIKKD